MNQFIIEPKIHSPIFGSTEYINLFRYQNGSLPVPEMNGIHAKMEPSSEQIRLSHSEVAAFQTKMKYAHTKMDSF